MTIVDGTISVNPNNVGVGAGPHLEGLYVSKTFATGTKGPGIADNQLHIRGSVTSSTFSLQRDLLDGNQNNPGEFIESAPDLLFLYPKELGVKKVEWTEVAP